MIINFSRFCGSFWTAVQNIIPEMFDNQFRSVSVSGKPMQRNPFEKKIGEEKLKKVFVSHNNVEVEAKIMILC